MQKTLKGAIRLLLPRSHRRHTILGGPLRGSEIVTSWHDYPAAILGRTERPLLGCFAKHVGKGETWLDIGAHYGYTAIALSKLVGPAGRVFAFEPMVNTAGCVARTRLINNFSQLTVVPMGLANCEDITLESLDTVRGMIDSTLPDSNGFKETFMASRLDWLWPKLSGSDEHIDGVKIDVQGMEIHVLEGAAELMKKFHPKLIIEIHKGVSRPRLFDLLTSIGYDPRGLCVEPLPGETKPICADDRSYVFAPMASHS